MSSIIKVFLTAAVMAPCFSAPAFAGGANEVTELSEAQLKLGKRAYIRCQACHTLGAEEAHLVGPNLNALFTSTAGEKAGFEYSEALAKSDVQWTEESLRAWLKSPSAFIPGNKMAFAGVPSEKEMDALLAYLKEKTK